MVSHSSKKRLSDRTTEMQTIEQTPVLEFRTKLLADDMTTILKGAKFGMCVALYGKTRVDAEQVSGSLKFLGISHHIETYPDGIFFFINNHQTVPP